MNQGITYTKSQFLQKMRNSTGISDFITWPRINNDSNGTELTESIFRSNSESIWKLSDLGLFLIGSYRFCILHIWQVNERLSQWGIWSDHVFRWDIDRCVLDCCCADTCWSRLKLGCIWCEMSWKSGEIEFSLKSP